MGMMCSTSFPALGLHESPGALRFLDSPSTWLNHGSTLQELGSQMKIGKKQEEGMEPLSIGSSSMIHPEIFNLSNF